MPRQKSGSIKAHSERRVRNEARKIFDQLEKGLDTWYGVFGLMMLSALVGIGPYCWFTLDMVWWKAGAWGLGGTVAVTVVGGIAVAIVEHSKAQSAVRRFNLRFPEGTERRQQALTFLSDFTPTNDGSTKFLEEVLPPSLRANLNATTSGIVEDEDAQTAYEEAVPQQREPARRRSSRRRKPRRESIPVDFSRDPDALIPLELPPDVQRKGRGS
jgi:hypothetical protein